MMTTCGVAGRWSRHRVRPWRWGAWAVAASTDILPSTLHTTPQLLHLHHTDSLTRTCILSQHCNRDTFCDLDFVVPPALSYQHTPSFLGFSCGAAETVAIRHVAVALLNMNRSQSMIVTFSDALPEWFILWAAVELATMSAFDENPFAVSTVIDCATIVH